MRSLLLCGLAACPVVALALVLMPASTADAQTPAASAPVAPEPRAEASAASPSSGLAATLAAQLKEIQLDPNLCYRVRDISFQEGDASYYLTDGYLAFARPVHGRYLFAIFSATESLQDGEVLLRPPDLGERTSLAHFTQSPNLDEHFRSAVLISTGSRLDQLHAKLSSDPDVKKIPELASLLGPQSDAMLRNLGASFQVRIVQDLLSGDVTSGLFYAAIMGKSHGNFDVLYEPTSTEQMIVGRVADGPKALGFDVWASFATRAVRRSGPSYIQQGKLSNYRIDATLNQDLTLQLKTRVTLTALRKVNGAVSFEIAPEMTVDSATIDGNPVEIFRRESMRSDLINNRANETFLLVLKEPLAANSSHELEFTQHGRVIVPSGNGVYYVGARMNWYPSFGLNHAIFDLTFRVPKPLQLVATGELIEKKDEGEVLMSHWRTPAPVRVAGFNLGDYEHLTVERAGLTIHVYANRKAEAALQPARDQLVVVPPALSRGGSFGRRPVDVVSLPGAPPPDARARLHDLAMDIGRSMEWMSASFGPPPLKTLTVSPIPGNFGQGFPGLLYISTLSFLKEQERPADTRSQIVQLFYTEILQAHEAAHQWWGNLVSPESYHDDWLQEALANYCAFMILERNRGPQALDRLLGESIELLRRTNQAGATVESRGPVTWGYRLKDDSSPLDPWRIVTYEKGTWILHMLRRRMGDEQFLRMLGELRKRYEYKTVSTEQFRALAVEFLPKGQPDDTLEVFFDSWVYSTGIPTLESSTSVKGRAPAVDLAITLKQTGVSDRFEADVPVEIRIPGIQKPMVKWIRTSNEPVTFHVKLKAAPSRVDVAPGTSILAVRK